MQTLKKKTYLEETYQEIVTFLPTEIKVEASMYFSNIKGDMFALTEEGRTDRKEFTKEKVNKVLQEKADSTIDAYIECKGYDKEDVLIIKELYTSSVFVLAKKRLVVC